MTQSKVSFHHVLYTKSLSKVQSWCFFTQNISHFIWEGKSTCEDFKCGLIKQPLGLFLFFLFITGKRQLVNPSGGWLAGNHIQKLYLVSVPQTQDVGESYDVFQHLLTTRMRFGKYASQSRSKAYLDSHSVFSLPKTSMHMFCSKSLHKSLYLQMAHSISRCTMSSLTEQFGFHIRCSRQEFVESAEWPSSLHF